MQIFDEAKIPYKTEVSFSDLKGKNKQLLRFDFAVFNQQQLLFLLEVDGQQHFKYIPYFHKTYSKFKRQKEWDRRKNAYCLSHNIPLLRIPYWDLENLTLEKILYTPKYRVTTMYHNDNIINYGVMIK